MAKKVAVGLIENATGMMKPEPYTASEGILDPDGNPIGGSGGDFQTYPVVDASFNGQAHYIQSIGGNAGIAADVPIWDISKTCHLWHPPNRSLSTNLLNGAASYGLLDHFAMTCGASSALNEAEFRWIHVERVAIWYDTGNTRWTMDLYGDTLVQQKEGSGFVCTNTNNTGTISHVNGGPFGATSWTYRNEHLCTIYENPTRVVLFNGTHSLGSQGTIEGRLYFVGNVLRADLFFRGFFSAGSPAHSGYQIRTQLLTEV